MPNLSQKTAAPWHSVEADGLLLQGARLVKTGERLSDAWTGYGAGSDSRHPKCLVLEPGRYGSFNPALAAGEYGILASLVPRMATIVADESDGTNLVCVDSALLRAQSLTLRGLNLEGEVGVGSTAASTLTVEDCRIVAEAAGGRPTGINFSGTGGPAKPTAFIRGCEITTNGIGVRGLDSHLSVRGVSVVLTDVVAEALAHNFKAGFAGDNDGQLTIDGADVRTDGMLTSTALEVAAFAGQTSGSGFLHRVSNVEGSIQAPKPHGFLYKSSIESASPRFLRSFVFEVVGDGSNPAYGIAARKLWKAVPVWELRAMFGHIAVSGGSSNFDASEDSAGLLIKLFNVDSGQVFDTPNLGVTDTQGANL